MLSETFAWVFRALVYGQMFFWWWLYDQDWLNSKVSEHAIELLLEIWLGGVAFFVAWNHWGVSQYTPDILVQYCLFYYLAWSIYRTRFHWVQSLSLMGLTVFLNSYYWELVYHVTEFQTLWTFTPNMILQMVHLLPALFFIKRFDFDKNWSLNQLTIGLIISFVVAFVTIRYLHWDSFSQIYPMLLRKPTRAMFHFLNRILCLFVLIRVVINGDEKV